MDDQTFFCVAHILQDQDEKEEERNILKQNNNGLSYFTFTCRIYDVKNTELVMELTLRYNCYTLNRFIDYYASFEFAFLFVSNRCGFMRGHIQFKYKSYAYA